MSSGPGSVMEDRCRLCGGLAGHFANAQLLETYDVAWFRCSDCGFVQTENPYWLKHAYSRAITRSDIGLVGRNLRLARITTGVISTCFDPRGVFVDYAGGYGLLVRLMRDAGYDFRLLEPHCENLFAAGFEAAPGGHYELVTAFEVVEHFAEPLDGFRQLASLADNFLVSTLLLPANAPGPGEWWYYGLEHGQHVAIYSERSLQKLAESLGFQYCSDGVELHLFSRRRVSRRLFRMLCRWRVALLVSWLKRRPSLLDSDFETLLRESGYTAEAESLRHGRS